ncbi:MAG: DUF427 domain-containing protein [Anaerolineae bacterium]|nr:DUF427 domain-containing protein [Anaerolineae bacterium]
MAKAIVNGVVLAESDKFEVVEGNIYFPPESVNKEYFSETSRHTTCPWKGEASYYTLKVGDTVLENAAWFYPQPKNAAEQIRNHVAFYPNKVQIERE